MYIETPESNNIISWASKRFADAFFVIYEPIGPDDSFGKTMIRNIAARGCELKSIQDFPTCQAQELRAQKNGFPKAQCWNMQDVYYTYLNAVDRARYIVCCLLRRPVKQFLVRVEKLELFDEVEEYHLLQQHYCLLLASNNLNSRTFDACWFNH